MLVNDLVVVEIKAIEVFNEVHVAQCMTYLKLTNKRLCLLINFNTVRLKDGGVKRVVLGL